MAGSHPSSEFSSRSVSSAGSQRTNSWSGRDEANPPAFLSFIREYETRFLTMSDACIYQKPTLSSLNTRATYCNTLHINISFPTCSRHVVMHA